LTARIMSDQGGDPACWANRVCDECGQLIEDDTHVCRRSNKDQVDSPDDLAV